MKPGKNDIPVRVKISGMQLTQLQRHSVHMIEAYGLDSEMENYNGYGLEMMSEPVAMRQEKARAEGR